MSGKFLILGAGGQVASAFAAIYKDKAILATCKDIDLNSDFIPALNALVGQQEIACVINAAAYTQVDKCGRRRQGGGLPRQRRCGRRN